MFKVVITDQGYETIDQERRIVSEAGGSLVSMQCRTEDDVIACTADADAVICQFAPITARVIKEMKKCKVIVRYAVGVDTIDLAAAEQQGIYVCNVPDYGTEEVALHAAALILASARKLTAMADFVRSGGWGYLPFKPIRRFSESVVALVGFGRIPQIVVRNLLPLGARILVHDPYVDSSAVLKAGAVPADMETICSEAHYISLHAPLSEKTAHMMNWDVFSSMKQKPFIINTARGGLIDEQALLRAVEEELISGAALDVCEKEPISKDNPLLCEPRIVITPHSAWYSEESILALQRSAAEEAVRVATGKKPKNPAAGPKKL